MPEKAARFRPDHPAWAVLLAALPLAFGFFRGPALIDDAHITFRYAENLARGRGFVFNSEPMLGATAPFYCLLLALLRVLGASPPDSAFAIGVVAAAVTPVLLWRIGVAGGRPGVGLLAGMLLALMPDWWLNAKTGMETTLAGMLLALTVLLDLAGRPAAGGVAAALLVLTRPDAAAFPVLILARHLFGGRRRASAVRFALAGAATLLPWVAYSTLAFGSPLPHSLAAKRLIHFLPLGEALVRNFGWLAGIREGSAGMSLLFALWLVGVVAAALTWRRGLPFLIWPLVSLLALSLLEIGPFFWYRVPLLPAVALGAALGFAALRALCLRVRLPAVAAILGLIPIAAVALLVARSGTWLWQPRNLLSAHAKELALADMAREIRERAGSSGRNPASLTVYVGEVGVLAYALPDSRIIDSSGINSPEVLELRRRDRERMRRAGEAGSPAADREQSPEWSREVIRRFRPDFIASDDRYLHLPELAREPWFQALYRPVRNWTFPNGVSLILLERWTSPAGGSVAPPEPGRAPLTSSRSPV